MKNDWILDVIADLKSFAHMNDLPQLAEKLSEVAETASTELTFAERKASRAHGDRRATRRLAEEVGGS